MARKNGVKEAERYICCRRKEIDETHKETISRFKIS